MDGQTKDQTAVAGAAADGKGKLEVHEDRTVIARGTIIRGALFSDCPVTISGEIEGELQAPSLVITEAGRVHGSVQVEDLTSAGELSGEIDANTVILAGRVRDNTSIRAASLEVKLATDADKLQVTFGAARLEVGETPAKLVRAQAAAPKRQPSEPANQGEVVPSS